MKVIFLDIDGVINSHDNIWARTALWKDLGVPSRDEYGHLFDERCVMLLEWIISKTGCKIVISSTWRKSGLLAMERMWKDRGLPGEVVGVTLSYPLKHVVDKYPNEDGDRGYEIQDWIDRNKPERYCIIDDDSDMLSHQSFVQTDHISGLTFKKAKEVIKILNE